MPTKWQAYLRNLWQRDSFFTDLSILVAIVLYFFMYQTWWVLVLIGPGFALDVLRHRAKRTTYPPADAPALSDRIRSILDGAGRQEIEVSVIVVPKGVPYYRLNGRRFTAAAALGELLTDTELEALVRYQCMRPTPSITWMKKWSPLVEFGVPLSLIGWTLLGSSLHALTWLVAVMIALAVYRRPHVRLRLQVQMSVVAFRKAGGDIRSLITAVLKVWTRYSAVNGSVPLDEVQVVIDRYSAVGGVSRSELEEMASAIGADARLLPPQSVSPLRRVGRFIPRWTLTMPLLLLLGVLLSAEFWLYRMIIPQLETEMWQSLYGEDVATTVAKAPEARQWLYENKNPYPLAGNRFDGKKEAQTFVEELYQAGAVRVVVKVDYDEPWRIEKEGGPYADVLIVLLPQDRDARKRLFAVEAREAQREGFDPSRDTGQKHLFLWWD